MRTHALWLRSCLLYGCLLLLAGCNDGSGDPKAQIGPNPKLPELQQYLLPPMHIARVVGWQKDETPRVAQGAARDRPAASALALYASQWRCAGGGIEGAGGRGDQAAEGNRHEFYRRLGDLRRQYWRATASRCCATPMATAFRIAKACSSIISIRHSAWRWLATISTSPTPTLSSDIPIMRVIPRSQRRARP